MKPKIRDDVAVVEIDSDLVIYDRAEDGLHHLNPAAGIVFQLCDGTGTTEEMARDISDVGGLPYDEVMEQVHHVVHHFRDLGILEGAPAPGNEEQPPVQPSETRDAHQHDHAHDHGPAGEQDHAEDPPKDPAELEEQDTQNH